MNKDKEYWNTVTDKAVIKYQLLDKSLSAKIINTLKKTLA